MQSYGSVLGQYFAAMYPDKVGRLVIDGVYDANDYRATQWYSNLEDTDVVFSSFYHFCHEAGPSKCPLYTPTVAGIRQRVDDIISTLSRAPIPIPFASNAPAVITKKEFHMLMFVSTYAPLAMFKVLAESLIAVETYNLTTLANVVEGILGMDFKCMCKKQRAPWLGRTQAFNAVACGDGEEIPDGPGDYEAYFDKLTAKSSFASPIWGLHYLQCAHWKIRPKTRYTAPFIGNTSHPILVVSPSFDPVCPLKDARAVQKRYTGSRLLVQNSYGHCSIASPSLCTAKNIRAYFIDGTLPEEGLVCDVDELPFIGDVRDKASLSSHQDTELLEALRVLAGGVPRFGLF
jgi:pimeloyl-ACP methyl ester carboxylesterase